MEADVEGYMTKRQAKTMVARIEKHKAAIAKHRDALREIIGDVEAICDGADEAVHSLSDATDRLSEYI